MDIYDLDKDIMDDVPQNETDDQKRLRDESNHTADEDEMQRKAKRRAEYRKRMKEEMKADGAGEKRHHCAPYDNNYSDKERTMNSEYLSGGAEDYYELLGSCQCWQGSRWTCDAKRIVRSKFTPWTRFPTAKGMFCETFRAWANPHALRNPKQMRDCMKLFLKSEGGKLVPDYTDTSGTAKWYKFWYAVDMLYKWVTHETVLEDEEVKVHTSTFLQKNEKIKFGLTKDDVRKYYELAGLLAPESIDHWVNFRNCRNFDMDLSDSQKDELMNLLLTEKRRAVDLFEKVSFLQRLSISEGGDYVRIRRLRDDELSHHMKTQKDLLDARQNQQAAVAEAMDGMKKAEAAKKEQESAAKAAAAEALIELMRSQPLNPKQDVCMLLKCLQRLVLNEVVEGSATI